MLQRQIPTQQTQEKNIRVLIGIRTRGPNNRSAADLRLRPQGHSDRQCYGRSSNIHTCSDTDIIALQPPLIFIAVYMH